ncbi:HigA family addiction module antitoxin [Altererythrobacter sp. Z27]|uniref:HigA family addiction module antitoxin n=1 Tax=Altererythrobacter sp. Z27 TaxID=3461147 RepID=UPI004044A896
MMNGLMKGLPPVHPGEVLREDVIPGSGMTKTAFATQLGMSREALHNVLSGKSAVSTLMALKLARLLGTSAKMWLNMQQAYDLAVTAESKKTEIEKVEKVEFA